MKRTRLVLISLAIVLLIVMGMLPVMAAVKDSDWIKAPADPLTKCPGGSCDHTDCDYVYSFAIVGDTQNLNYTDAKNYVKALETNPSLTYSDYTQAYMRTLYNWILDKQDDLNIQYVMGVGDITQSFNVTQTYYDEEWPLAKEAISLLDGKIGYSLVRGNHDISSGLNTYFGVGTTYYNDLVALSQTFDAEGRPMGGIREADKVEDSYRKIVAGGNKYIIFALEYYPTEETVTWMNELLTANSDYTAIVTLHCFLGRDRTFVDLNETTTPEEDAAKENWAGTATGGMVDPRQLWERVLSKHANVQMVISGHVDEEDVLINSLQGDNGNTVTFMLTDTQTIDSETPVGIVTMLYFSADGKVAHVEHISTVREAAGQNAYLRNVNQFTLDLENAGGWTETKYGFVPTEQYEANTFHVLLDDDGNADNDSFWCGSFPTLSGAIEEIVKYKDKGGSDARKLKEYYILMSKDYTNTEFVKNTTTQVRSGITFDLGGHTVTTNNYLFPMYNRGDTFVPNVTIKNGNVVMNGAKAPIVVQTSVNATSQLNLTVENVNFSYSGSAASVVSYFPGTTGELKGSVDLTFKDCSVDTTGASGAVTVFNLKDDLDNNNVTLTLDGLTVKGTTAANTVLYTKNSDTVRATGNSVSVSLTENTAYDYIVEDEGGAYHAFATPTSQDGRYVYTLATNVLNLEETPYGFINADTYPASTYPFVLFQNGKMVAAYKTWKDFCSGISVAATAQDKNAVLYVRRDYNTDNCGGSSIGLHKVRYLTIDLNGKKLIRGAAHIFQLMASNNYDFTSNIRVKNGTISVEDKNKVPIVFNGGSAAGYKVSYNVTFDNVTFTSESGFSGRLLIECYGDGAAGSSNTVIFNDCTFDTSNTGVASLFRLKDSSGNKYDVNVIINGGKWIASKNLTFATFDDEREAGKGSPDSVTFGKGSDGQDFYMQMASSVAHPTTAITTTAGVLYPMEVADDGTNAKYLFKSNVTKYGTIGTGCLSEVNYPFVLFQDGKFVAGYGKWYDFLAAAKNIDWSKNTTLLLRRDYNTTECGAKKSSSALYTVGKLLIDLGGNTFTRGDNHMFQAIRMNDNACHVDITIENGTLCMEKNYSSLVAFNSSTSTVADLDVRFDFTFNGVTITSTSEFKGRLVSEAYSNGTYGSKGTLVFNDCTFEITSGVSKLFQFEEANDQNKLDVAVIINGGRINSVGKFITIATFSAEREAGKGSPDSLTFGAYNGEYTVYTIASGSMTTAEFDVVDGGKAVFVSTGKTGEYVLTPKACEHEYDNACDKDCNLCGEERPAEHEYDTVVTDPTCSEEGYTTHTCSVCRDSYRDSIVPATGEHTYDNEYDVDCNVCGAKRPIQLCGATATWRYEDGILYIEGSGSMNAFGANSTPWEAYKSEITAVIVADGIRSIGKSAFYGFESLESVELPATLKTIGAYAFYGCASLTEITIPESVTTIREYAFRRSGVTAINFGINYGWSAGDMAINSFELSASGAAELLKKASFNVDWTRDVNAEPQISNLIAAGSIGAGIKWTLDNEGTLAIEGDGVIRDFTTNGAPWNEYKAQITTVAIGEGITKLGKCSFYGYEAITTVSLPSTLTGIGNYAFYGCKGLTEVTIPASVTTIGSYAFRKSGVVTVIFENVSGWTYGGEAIDVTNSTNVAYLLNKVSYLDIWEI